MGNFSRFVQHLDGLISVYNLPDASAADKTRAWTALTVLEQDLETIYSSYRLLTFDLQIQLMKCKKRTFSLSLNQNRL